MNQREWEETLKSEVFQNFIKIAKLKNQDQINQIKNQEEQYFNYLENLEPFEHQILSSAELTQTFKQLQTKFAMMNDQEKAKANPEFIRAVELLVLP